MDTEPRRNRRMRPFAAPRPFADRIFFQPLPCRLLALLAACLLLTGAGAPEGPDIARKATLADLVRQGHAHNPQVAMKKADWRARVEKVRAESGYPDPQLMVTWFTDPIETRLGPQDWNLTLTQAVPFPGRLSRKAEALAKDAEIARLELNAAEREMIVAIRESWHELIYIRAAKEVAAANERLLEQLRRGVESGHAEDRATLNDVIRAQSQAAQLRYDVLLLDELEQTEVTRLNALLNREPEAAVGRLVPEAQPPLALSLPEIRDLVEKNREEIRIAGLRKDKAEIGRSLAGYSSLPELRFGLFYAEIGQPEMSPPPRDAGRDAVGLQAGITIPLWFGKNRSAARQAEAEEDSAGFARGEAVNRARAAVREVYFRLRNAERLVVLYRDSLLPQALATLNAAESWNREGEGSFSDLIEAQATVYNFQLSLARAQADAGKFLARLEGLAGTRLIEASAPAAEGETP
ncbi:MAG: TolC family protein [Thermodesulfobacteriota bacterium]